MSTNHSPVVCACCGAPTHDEKRIDVRFVLPDAALALPEEARHQEGGIGALLRAVGAGCFVRCLLPVQLTGGTELVVGTWLRISDGDLERARAVWEKPAFADLTLTGTLANSIQSLGDGLLGAEVTVMVRDPGEIPYVVASDSPAVTRVLGEVFDRDRVLSTFGHPLPVAVRTRLDEWWSIERTAGLAARVVNGTSQFADSGRAVYADLLRDEADRDPADWLAQLTSGAPTVPKDQRITEALPDGIRHAFWLTAQVNGQEQHQLYGFTVHRETAVVIGCFWNESDALPWAQHVWRSVRRATEESR